MPALNVKDRKALKASLDHWKRELAHARRDLTGPQRLHAAAARRVQIAQARIARRSHQLDALPGPRKESLKLALGFVGVTEDHGTNTGATVDRFEARFHMHAQPWCGAFVGYCAEVGGGANLTDRIVFTPYIEQDAEAGRNGLSHVVWSRGRGWHGEHVAHTFDLALYDFGTGTIEHVEALRKPWKGNGPLLDVGGNTSFANGSPNDGGAVAIKGRAAIDCVAIVSIAWPTT